MAITVYRGLVITAIAAMGLSTIFAMIGLFSEYWATPRRLDPQTNRSVQYMEGLWRQCYESKEGAYLCKNRAVPGIPREID